MRTRFLTSVVAVAAALLAPSAAFADVGAPTLDQPPSPTAVASVALHWSNVAGEDGYRVYRAAADCGGVPTDITALAGGDLAPDIQDFSDNSPAEGTRCYFVRAFAGIIESPDSNHVLVTYDSQPPSAGSVTAPIGGAVLSALTGPITVTSADADDATSGVASVQFFSSPTGLTTWTAIGTASSGPPYSVNWSPPNGNYDIYARITDNVGHFIDTTPNVGVRVDSTVPTSTLTSPGAVIHGASVTMNAASADTGGSGLQTVEYQWSVHNADSWTTFDTETTASSTGSLNTTTQLSGDGHYDLRTKVTDNADNVGFGNTVSDVLVDNTPPSATLTSPGAVIHGTAVTMNATVVETGSGISTVEYQSSPHGTNTWTTFDTETTASSTGTLNTTLLGGDGFYDLRVRATDVALNPAGISNVVANVRVDNTAPAATLISPGAVIRGTAVPMNANVTETGSGIGTVEYQWSVHNANSWTTFDTKSTASSTGSLDTTLLGGDGFYDLRVRATDLATNVGVSTTISNVRVDNTVPTVTLAGVAGATSVRGTLSLTSAPTDAGSGVFSVAYGRRPAGSSSSFTTIGSSSAAPSYGVSFNTTSLNGLFEIQALATDVAGNTASVSVTSVLIDNTPPPTPAKPTGLTSVSAAPTITFVPVTDPLTGGVASGVAHYDVYRNSDLTPLNVDPIPPGGPYTWSDVAGQSLSPATGTQTYSYSVVAVDAAGNSSAKSTPLAIFLDTTAASAATSLTAQATPTNQRPHISWVAPTAPGFTHYRVYRDGVQIDDVSATSFTDLSSGLLDNTYTYQLVAADAGNTTFGLASAPVTVQYDATAPSAPGSVSAGAALDGSVSIGWAASADGAGSGIARYIVRRSLSSTPPATPSDGDATCQGTATSCTDTTTLNGKLYSYAVFAVDKAGNASAAGNSQSVTARDQTAPAVPTGLAATPGDASVSLSWTPAGADDDVAGYVLVAKQGTAAPTSEADGTRVCNAIIGTSSTCLAGGLTNGATYTFGLFALDEALNRSAAAVVSAAPNGHVDDTKAPAAVTKLHVKLVGHKITLTWKNPSDKDFDHVEITASQRKPSAKTGAKRVYSGKGTKVTTRLAAGQSRWFVVVAYDAAGNASAPASVRATIAPASPFGPAPRSKVRGKVRLSWPVVKGAKYYNVQIYRGKKRILVVWPARHALVLPRAKLAKGKKYTWYVWPGIGAKAKAHYGKLIGKNVFTFTG